MLKCDNLSFYIRDKALISAISLQFMPGVLYGILGPNGSGKTTFLKTLAGIWQPTSGSVFWKGDNLHLLDRKEIAKIVTYVPQNAPLVFDYTVEEFVLLGRYAHQGKQAHHLLEWALKVVRADQFRSRKINTLSSGEKQRIYIARALMTESPVLLCDEPTNCLDIRHQIEIWNLLKTLAQEGKLILVTNHDLIATKQFCNEIAVFQGGSCASIGEWDAILQMSLLKDVFGVAPIEDGRFEVVS